MNLWLALKYDSLKNRTCFLWIVIQEQGTPQWQTVSLPVEGAILVRDHSSNDGINAKKPLKVPPDTSSGVSFVVLEDAVNIETQQGDEDCSLGFSPPWHRQALLDQGCRVTRIAAGTHRMNSWWSKEDACRPCWPWGSCAFLTKAWLTGACCSEALLQQKIPWLVTLQGKSYSKNKFKVT